MLIRHAAALSPLASTDSAPAIGCPARAEKGARSGTSSFASPCTRGPAGCTWPFKVSRAGP
jgi:hypothetical protein